MSTILPGWMLGGRRREGNSIYIYIYVEGRLAMWSPWRAIGAAGSGGG